LLEGVTIDRAPDIANFIVYKTLMRERFLGFFGFEAEFLC